MYGGVEAATVSRCCRCPRSGCGHRTAVENDVEADIVSRCCLRRSLLSVLRSGTVMVAMLLCPALLYPAAALASGLLAAGSGIPDQAMAFATVGKPLTPSAAAFANPAGLAGFDGSYLSAGIGIIDVRGRVNGAPYSGYQDDDERLAFSPAYAMSFEGADGWHYGLALYGSVGLGYYFDKDPEAGWNEGFVSETSVLSFALGAAYEINEKWVVGAALVPQFGNIRTHFAIPGQDGAPDFSVKYKLNGPGLQANAGVQWKPYEGLYLGLGLRSPGMVWASGSSVLPGLGRRDLNLDMELPMQVTAGVNADLTERLFAGISVRWSDSSSFQSSYFRFGDAPDAFDYRMFEAARYEWRYTAGFSYRCLPRLTLLAGFDYANTIVGDRALSPLLYDTATKSVSAGMSLAFTRWTADVSLLHTFGPDRDVGPDQALILPGSYGGGGSALLLGVRGSI